jgi:hypothetical protein
MEVSDNTGSLIGLIEEEWTMWTPKFRVRDAQVTVKLYITGSFIEGGGFEFKVILFKSFYCELVSQ